MEIIIQPLINSLKGKGFYFRLSHSDNGYLLELGDRLQSKSLSSRKLDMIAGNELLIPVVTYKINHEGFTRTESGVFSRSAIEEVDKLVNDAFKFRDTHHVTKWEDK